MVQTYQSPVRIYKHPFEVVMVAYEKRFPTCPQIPIFVGSEVMEEYNSPDGAEWVIERNCQLNVDAPYIVKKIAGVDYVYFTQKNSLNRRNRTLLIEATNITFSQRIVVKENCNYYVHPDNPNWTCFEQNAALDVKSFFGFETAVEKLAVKQYAANLAKGKEILEFFIEEVLKNGVASIVPWQQKDSASTSDSAIDICRGEEEHIRRRDSKSVEVNVLQHSTSFDDPDAKLEAEYIRRFLGQLSPLEESRLCELKYSLHAHHKGKPPNDAHLLRFLRARDFDVAKARDMVHNSLIWRKQHNVDRIIQEWEVPTVIQQFFPGCWHHHDKDGRPLFILRLGNLDIKGLLRSCGVENLVKLTLLICEEGLMRAEEATKSLGVPISTWSLLVDLEGLSMRHLWRPGVQCLLKIIEIVEANYPETMGQVLVVRAPRVFPVLWTLISPFIDDNTRLKFKFNSADQVRSELKKFQDEQYIPDFLGGSCLPSCSAGGHIPKNLYRPVDLPDDNDVLSSTYTTSSMSRGSPVEILCHVSSAGCVLTWDFDILKSDCEFTVYHTHKAIRETTTPHSPTMLNPVEMVTAAIANNPLPAVAVDPTLRLGPDLTIEEKPVVFQEGDSMQGSHYCSRAGTYILQWKVPEVAAQHTTFDFSIGTHKSKIMYYYELLDSVGFRGSVASLESCRSSFSSLAPINSTPPTPGALRPKDSAHTGSP